MEDILLHGRIPIRKYKAHGKVKHVLLFVHGFGASRAEGTAKELADRLNKESIEVLAFDLPSHGENNKTEALSLQDCMRTLSEVAQFVALEYSGMDTSILGRSLGGYLALLMLEDSSVNYKNIILIAPAVFIHKSLKEGILEEHGYRFEDWEKALDLGYKQPLFVEKSFYDDLCLRQLENCFSNKRRRFFDVFLARQDSLINCEEVQDFFKRKTSSCHSIHIAENSDHDFEDEEEYSKVLDKISEILQEDQ